MNKRKRMVMLKHRRRLRKLKERRRLQALASLTSVTPETIAEPIPAEVPTLKRKVVRKEVAKAAATPKAIAPELALEAPTAEAVPAPKKRGRRKKETPSQS